MNKYVGATPIPAKDNKMETFSVGNRLIEKNKQNGYAQCYGEGGSLFVISLEVLRSCLKDAGKKGYDAILFVVPNDSDMNKIDTDCSIFGTRPFPPRWTRKP